MQSKYYNKKVFKLPKGTFKDNFLKYNMLKLLTTVALIFGGLYLVWGAFYGYFSQAPFLDESSSIETKAVVGSTKNGGYYYYIVANDELSINKYNSFQDQLSSKSERQLLEEVYKLTVGKNGNYKLKSNISKEEYKWLYQIQKEHDRLVENIIRGQKMPDDVLTNDTFPVIYEIGNLDHHFIGQKGQTFEEMREFLLKARENNLMFMFLTPLIPILGFLWLFFSVKHTYKRQQEEEKKRKSTKQS